MFTPQKEQKLSRPIAIDLFAGCGGLSFETEHAWYDKGTFVEVNFICSSIHKFRSPYFFLGFNDVKPLIGADPKNSNMFYTKPCPHRHFQY